MKRKKKFVNDASRDSSYECARKHQTDHSPQEPSYESYSCIVIIVIMSVIAAFSISLWIVDLCTKFVSWNSNNEIFDSVGIVCQVITTIITCVVSVLGISFSIQDYEKFDTKIKDLLTLRVDNRFSFLCSLLISFSLVVCNIIGLIFKWYFICFGSALISLILCFYILIIEIPYLHAQEKTLLAILKRYLVKNRSNPTFAEPFMTSVTALVKRNGLIETYRLLSDIPDSNCFYNRRLLNILLNIQEDLARNVQYIADKLEVERVTHRILDVLIEIITGRFDLSIIQGDEFVHYDNQIIRTMYLLSKKANPCHRSVAKAVAQLICFSEQNHLSARHNSFRHRILLSMVAIPIHNREYSVIKEIKAQYSQLRSLLGQRSDSTLMFALISMFLYYMIEVEQDVSNDWKEEIKGIVEFSGVINNDSKVESWKNLFSCFAELFQIDCSEFLEVFKENRTQMEFMLYSSGLHECRFYDDFGLRWYLIHYMNSYRFLGHNDFSNEFSYITSSPALRFYFTEFCKQCYSSNEFKPTQEMLGMVNFWGNRNNNFQAFARFENANHYFEQFYRQLIIEDEEKQNLNASSIIAIDYIPELRKNIEKSLRSEWGFDENLPLPNDQKKSLNILILQRAKVEETVEILSSSLPRSIFFEVRNMCQPYIASIPITGHAMDHTSLLQLLDSNIEVMVRDASYYDCFIQEADLKAKYQALCKSVPSVEGHIFKPALIAKNGFRFNVSIDLLEKYDLTDQQFNDLVEQYRRSDGQYFFEGVFMSRDEVARCLKNKYHLLVMEIRIAIRSEEPGIYEFEFMHNTP